ncbi:MAG: hypothetical protein NWR72_03920 [Bacteroidia bacterium]|nr:hypothetical protein [Bacteroidia bacterium]
MKRISFATILLALVFFVGLQIQATMAIDYLPDGIPYTESSMANLDDDPLLLNIQQKIDQAFTQAMMVGNSSTLDKIHEQLTAAYRSNPHNLIIYWQSYLGYYKSIFHLQNSDKKAAEKVVNQSVDMLEDMENPNAEDLALLALTKSFGIQFQSMMMAPITSGKVKRYAEKALEMDSTNLRAWYVLASNDFYTPEQYGGMTKAEGYLLTAIKLPAQQVSNPYLPSWGKDMCFEMLVSYYLKKNQMDKAQQYYDQAIALYPTNYQLLQLGTQISGQE